MSIPIDLTDWQVICLAVFAFLAVVAIFRWTAEVVWRFLVLPKILVSQLTRTARRQKQAARAAYEAAGREALRRLRELQGGES